MLVTVAMTQRSIDNEVAFSDKNNSSQLMLDLIVNTTSTQPQHTDLINKTLKTRTGNILDCQPN